MPLPRLPARRDGRVVAVLQKQEGKHTGTPNLKIKTDQFEWGENNRDDELFFSDLTVGFRGCVDGRVVVVAVLETVRGSKKL